MNFSQRVVDVITSAGSFGSGYVVANRLILTARHVIEPGGDVFVRTLVSGRRLPCQEVWTGRETDAALLEIIGSLPAELHGMEPAELGRLVGLSKPVACTAVGFPWSQERPDGKRDTEQIRGEINLGTALFNGRYQVSVSSGTPKRPAESSAWAGMSGAAVIADGFVIGVVAEDTPNFAGGRLTAEPILKIVREEGFGAAWLNASGTEPEVEPVELAPLTVRRPTAPKVGSPASLLRADSETVRFRGRTHEMQQLLAWAAGSGFGLRLMVGPGGQGKSRLGRELARHLRDQGWLLAWLPEHVDESQYERLIGNQERTLLIVDYAETRPHQVKRLILEARKHQGQALRILLIARSAGEWWARLRDDLAYDASELTRDGLVVELAELESSVEGRKATFSEAVADLAAAFPGPAIEPNLVQPPNDLSHRRYGSVLTLQLAALVSLLQAGPSALALPHDLPAEGVLLEHERRYWRRAALTFGVELDVEIRDIAVTMAALCGARDRDEALGLLSAVPGVSDQSYDLRLRTMKWLRDLYPTTEDHCWGPLEPDRIAEFLIAAALRLEPGLLPKVMAAASQDQVRRAITVLARASAHQPDTADHMTLLLKGLPRLAPIAVEVAPQSENPDSIVKSLMGLVKHNDCSADALISLGDSIPDHTQVLAELAVEVWATIATGFEEPVASREHLPGLATALNNLSNRLGVLGRHGDALDMAERALNAVQRYTDTGASEHPDLLAGVLHNLAAHLSRAGRISDALPVHRASVDAYRALAGHDESYMPDLAMALHSFAIALAQLNFGAEAIVIGREAVDVYRDLAANRPVYLPALATALSGLASRLAEDGQFAGAVSASQEAVAGLEPLADRNPDQHLPTLAAALNTLAIHLAQASRHAESFTTAEAAIAIYRQLSVNNPGAFIPRLAGALNNLGGHLASVGRHLEALSTSEEAVAAYRSLPEELLEENLLGLAQCLGNFGNRLAETGHAEASLSATRRTVEILVPFAEADPEAHAATLAHNRVNLAARFGALEQYDDGAYVAAAALPVLRQLADHHPERHEPMLATALAIYGSLLTKLEDFQSAVPLLIEAVLISGKRGLDRPFGMAVAALELAHRSAPAEVAATWTAATGLSFSTLRHRS